MRRATFKVPQTTMDAFFQTWHSHTCTNCSASWQCISAHSNRNGTCMHGAKASESTILCATCQLEKDFS